MINEPTYGNMHRDKEALAQALEAVRRLVCCYDMGNFERPAPNRCDCKYGLSIDKLMSGEVTFSRGGEKTGCPELRSVIYMLLHSEEM